MCSSNTSDTIVEVDSRMLSDPHPVYNDFVLLEMLLSSWSGLIARDMYGVEVIWLEQTKRAYEIYFIILS